MSNPLIELTELGQSIWYDQMQRSLLTQGHLARMIEEDGLRGLTSNPTIFDKAISGSHDYDEPLRKLALEGQSVSRIYEGLVREDIAGAADVFRPVYDRTGGHDGYVSLEVDPRLANETQGTIEEALRHFKALDRPNVMIKIPATDAGIPAIEEAIAAGLNVNVTLIFSQKVYARVIEAYLRGLERRVSEGKPIDGISSVASFFVSRIDSKADKAIKKRIEDASDPVERDLLASIEGKVAIANAKLAYQLFLKIFEGERFARLKDKGARVQRPLWASTSTKDPKYSDVLYVESLIGDNTVNTLPPATFDAFRDHGKPRLTLEEDLDEAKRVLDDLESSGIPLETITDELTEEGVKSFADSFESLLSTIEARRDAVLRDQAGREEIRPGSAREGFEAALGKIGKDSMIERLWKKDASMWKSEESHQAVIRASLGWLSVASWMQRNLEDLERFAAEARKDFDFVVLLGMGGSSLCAEVMKKSFGRQDGWPELIVLDSILPVMVESVEQRIDLKRTLFIVASKSGTTVEPNTLYRYFLDRVASANDAKPGSQFIAITDVGTALQKEAADRGFRETFVNPSDIGGRYSALSYFGMVPAALAGIDVRKLLDRAVHAGHVCSPSVPADENPGARLGAILGALALDGHNKLTLLASPPIGSLGLWIEQLIAESTGKEGRGILPIAGEPLAQASAYGPDRLFVWTHLGAAAKDDPIAEQVADLEKQGLPLVELRLGDVYDLADQFFLWEIAVAIAGAFLKINPFDQPNVQEAKDKTNEILRQIRDGLEPQGQRLICADEMMEIHAGADSPSPGDGSVEGAISAFLRQVPDRGYIALLDYIAETPGHEETISAIRRDLVEGLRVATTAGYGPRYLHSTGQLHKGGPDEGLFLEITADEGEDHPIPGQGFTFGTLARAQALGDFLALQAHGRKVLRVHLKDAAKGLERLQALVHDTLASSRR